MLKYAWRSLKNNRINSILFTIAILTILTVSTISLQSLLEVQAQINDDIKQYGRGSYDILVRQTNDQTPVEEELGVVEENYLGTGNGGITIDKWKEIKSLSDIEVAAPIASMGYFTGFSRTFDLSFPESSSHYITTFTTSDGVHEYTFGNEIERFHLAQDNYFDGFDNLVDLDHIGSVVSGEPPMFMIPQTYHLLVGIDMKQEQKLTGIPFNKLYRELTIQEKKQMSFADDSPIIRVLSLEDPQVPVTAHVKQKILPWNSEDTLALKEKRGLAPDQMVEGVEAKKQVFERLSDLEPISTNTYEFDLSQYIKPFYFKPFSLDYNGNKSASKHYATSISESSQFYSINPVDYQIHDDYLSVNQIGEESGVPIYRKIEQHGAPGHETPEVPFVLHPINSYSAKEYQQSLAASPLGIYDQAPTTTEDGTVIHETAAAGSFIASPAHGLIDINDTVHIKGDSPIDAIRIKVAGIGEYNADAEKKIMGVVEQLHQMGDFHIDVVAGASPTTMQMDVEGVGMVTQQWTSLGAAANITEGWSLTNFIISGLFILVGISYVINRIFFRKKMKQSESQLLSDIGWGNRHIKTFHLLELAILTLIASAAALLVILILIYIQWLTKTSLLLFSINLAIIWLITAINGLTKSKSQLTIKQGAPGKSIFVRNLYYYRKFIGYTFAQLTLVTLLLYFVVASILSTSQLTGNTNLGTFINNSIYLSLMIVVIAAISLALITVTESTTSFLTLRRTEMITLRDIGWKLRDVQSLCMKESATWTACSILLGSVIGLSLVIIIYDFSALLTGIALLVSAALYVLVLGTSYIVIRRQVKKES